ncbi:hypothetical protein Pelo_15921 [Pelomyxa schiedti]|nr:hypothetical protein Pelo_15921 [Pelomyxa schiedti]
MLASVPHAVFGSGSHQPGTTATAPECGDCGAREAQWWCTTCSAFLCNDDKAHHSRARKTASHNVVTVAQLRTQTSVTPAAPKPALCSKHPHEELRLYCNTDKSLICRDCTLIDHKNHDIVFSSDLSSKFKENIASLCSKLSLRLEKLSLSKHTAIGCCKNVDEVSENAEAEIRTEFAKIVAVVNAKEAQMLSELKKITETAKKIFQEHIEGCDNKMKDAQEAQEYAQQATTRFTDLQLVAVNDTLTSRVKKLCDSGAQNDSLAPNELKVRFECDSTAVCGTISSSLGRLVHNSTSGSLVPKAATRELKQLGSMVHSITPRPGVRLFVDNSTGKVYWDGAYHRRQLTEFANMTSFINNTNPRQFILKDVPNHPGGTYQAVHNGHVYCTPANAATMTKVRVSDGSTVATAPLPNAGHSGKSTWSWGGGTDICWYVDAGGVLYVVHAPPNEGNIHITRVDPDSLAILQTWTVPRIKARTGYAFVVCGKFYFGKSHNSNEIDGVFDTTTGDYDDTYRNTLPTCGMRVALTSWIPSTNQLLVIEAPDVSFRVFLFDNVALCGDRPNHQFEFLGNPQRGSSFLMLKEPCQDTSSTVTASLSSKQQEAGRVLMISRVAWEYAVQPVLAASYRSLEHGDVVWAFGAASALFPLVALVCRGVAAAPVVFKHLGDEEPQGHSRHWDVRCAAQAGSPACISWILRHKPTRNNTRECLSVLWGLCGGGHLEMARQLVDGDCAAAGTDERRAGGLGCDYGRSDVRWVKESGLAWPVGENDLRDEVRAIDITPDGSEDETLLSEVCRGGHLETAKWVVERFRLRESWELAAPFMAAVRAGKLEVARWLCGLCGVVWAVNTLGLNYPVKFYFEGNLEMVQWLVEVFPGSWSLEKPEKCYSPVGLAAGVMCNKKITLKERVEAFQWLRSHFSFDLQEVQTVATGTRGVESLMWLIETHGVQPPVSMWWWREVEGVESVEWLVKHLPMSVTAANFLEVCGNIKDDLHCVRVLLSEVVNLTPTDHEEALIEALSNGNIKIANWLEATFHIMEKNVNVAAPKANATLISLCKNYSNYCDTRAIRWFFEHVSADKIDESSLARADQRKWSKVLLGAVVTGWTPISSQLISCRAVDSSHAINSMKRVIHEYHLENQPEYIKYNNNVLIELINANNTRCAEWLIHNFEVTLEELGHPSCANKEISFPMWKMLLRVFPEITADFIRDHLWWALMSSPVHIEFAMKAVGITQAHMAQLDQLMGRLDEMYNEAEIGNNCNVRGDTETAAANLNLQSASATAADQFVLSKKAIAEEMRRIKQMIEERNGISNPTEMAKASAAIRGQMKEAERHLAAMETNHKAFVEHYLSSNRGIPDLDLEEKIELRNKVIQCARANLDNCYDLERCRNNVHTFIPKRNPAAPTKLPDVDDPQFEEIRIMNKKIDEGLGSIELKVSNLKDISGRMYGAAVNQSDTITRAERGVTSVDGQIVQANSRLNEILHGLRSTPDKLIVYFILICLLLGIAGLVYKVVSSR